MGFLGRAHEGLALWVPGMQYKPPSLGWVLEQLEHHRDLARL